MRCAIIPIILPTVGNASPIYQATSTEGDSGNGDLGRWQKNQGSTDGLSSSKFMSGYSKAFGVDLSPDNVAVATVYFVQGVLGLSRLAVSFYLKDDLQLDPAEVWLSLSLFSCCSYNFFLYIVIFFKFL